mmetsp:Transcript_24831/g.62449  ORF Transcript_24831/g.62449 Transcript_24831/m.62449 type:complete len:223 (+) Transcript_24831:590-1258(+)
MLAARMLANSASTALSLASLSSAFAVNDACAAASAAAARDFSFSSASRLCVRWSFIRLAIASISPRMCSTAAAADCREPSMAASSCIAPYSFVWLVWNSACLGESPVPCLEDGSEVSLLTRASHNAPLARCSVTSALSAWTSAWLAATARCADACTPWLRASSASAESSLAWLALASSLAARRASASSALAAAESAVSPFTRASHALLFARCAATSSLSAAS